MARRLLLAALVLAFASAPSGWAQVDKAQPTSDPSTVPLDQHLPLQAQLPFVLDCTMRKPVTAPGLSLVVDVIVGAQRRGDPIVG